MKALCWFGKHDVRVETVPDPKILNPRDAILRVTSTAICGSDLHLYDGYIPGMRPGDVLGHEFMGEVVEVGAKSTLEKGQRVVVPFTISCGDCFFCKKQQYSACDNSNPAETFEASRLLMGHPMGAAFGYAHLTGGYAGGQAEYVRVPYSDGGPVGLFAIQSALIMGAHRVIAIDHYPRRLELAKQLGAEILDYREVDVREALDEMTGGIGPDACIDCVGMESHGLTIDNIVDTVKAHTLLGTERPHALRQIILACRKGGRISIPGVYGGFADKFPLGQMMEKGLTLKQGQTHVQKYTKT